MAKKHAKPPKDEAKKKAEPPRDDRRMPACANAPTGGPIAAPEAGQPRAAAANRWDKAVLNVSFLDADANDWGDTIRQKVQQYAPVWSQYANIQFTFDESRPADITIQTQPDASFPYTIYQSYYGPQSLQFRPSMWLLFPPASVQFPRGTPESEFQRVILHEFGHALGLIHEHKRADSGIVWNEQAVYDYYSYTGWSQQKIKEQIIDPYSGPIVAQTAFDVDSIMIYPIPEGLANMTVAMTEDLSPLDKSFIGWFYPFAASALPEQVLHLGAQPAAGAIGAPTQAARYSLTVPEPGRYTLEARGPLPALLGLFRGPQADQSQRVAAAESRDGEGARIVADLKPGVTYHAEVRHARNDGTGDFALSLNKA